MVQSSVEAIVVEPVSREIEVANVELKSASNGKSEGCLSRSRWSIEKITASVGDTLVDIPLSRFLEVLDVV